MGRHVDGIARGGGAGATRGRESGSRAGSARPKSSRPSSAKKRSSKDDPNSIGTLEDCVADLDDADKEAAFPKARGLVSERGSRKK